MVNPTEISFSVVPHAKDEVLMKLIPNFEKWESFYFERNELLFIGALQ